MPATDLAAAAADGDAGALEQAAAEWAAAPGEEVHLLHLDLTRWVGAEEACRATLSPDECERAARYAFGHLTRRFVLRRGLLRRLLGAATGHPAGALCFRHGPYGKPALDLPGAPHFNLSDSEDDVVVALSRRHPVGVDVERCRPLEDVDALAGHILCAAERAAYEALPHAWRSESLLRVWTAKEAVAKALGTGLSTPPAAIEVSLRPDRGAMLARVAGETAAGWTLREVPLVAHAHVAVAIPASTVTVRYGSAAS